MLISIVIPAYNAENYIERSAASVLAQTHRELELLIVDDGSRDGTFEAMKRIAGADPRVRIFRKENGGAASARNLAIREAGGEYLGFVDADDYITPDMIEKMLAGLAGFEGADRPVILQLGRREVDEEGESLPDVLPPVNEPELIGAKEFIRRLYLYTGDSSMCTKLTPRSLLAAHPFPEGRTGEDFRLLFSILPESGGVLSLPGTGYCVVHRKGSVTRRGEGQGFSRAYMDVITNAGEAEPEVLSRWPDLLEEAVRFGLYVREDYMLHVPIGDMNRQNRFYRDVLSYLRDHFAAMLRNPYLARKDKFYLVLFASAPRFVRRVHRCVMKLRAGS